MTTCDDVLAYIMNIASRDEVELIQRAAIDRGRMIGRIEGAKIKVGATVEIHNISPKYLSGLRGKVEHIQETGPNKRYANVRLPSPVWRSGRFYGREVITGVPVACLTVIHEEAPADA